MSKGRHSANNASNNSRHKFNILPILIFLIIVIILLLLYHFRDSIYTFLIVKIVKTSRQKLKIPYFQTKLLMKLILRI